MTIRELVAIAMMLYPGMTDEYIEWHWSLKELAYYVTKGMKWRRVLNPLPSILQ